MKASSKAGARPTAGLDKKRHLECRQWADHSKPGLDDHDTDCQQVYDAEPAVANPGPSARLAGEYEQQANHYKSDE